MSGEKSAAQKVKEALIRAGVCPECSHYPCMADGKTGLWCMNCDASYTLDGCAWPEQEPPGRRAVVVRQGVEKAG